MLFIKILFLINFNLFISTNRPIQKILFLLINIYIIIFILRIIAKTSWLPLIFIIIIIRGLMVLFIYISSITSNRFSKLYFNFSYINNILLFILSIKITFFFKIFNFKLLIINENIYLNIFNIWNNSIWIYILIIILFYFIVVNLELISNFNNPIRSKIY